MIMDNNEEELKFNVDQILASNKFTYIEKDVLKTILNKTTRYDLEQVNFLLEEFKKGDVK